MVTFLEILSILFTSMIKFSVSPLLAFSLGYDIPQTLVINGIGGCAGVVVFYLSSGWLMDKIALRNAQKDRAGRRSFTRTNKMIVKVKRDQGAIGLAAITPVLISIPIGTVLAARYFRHDKRTLPVLFSSVLIWDVILTGIWSLAK